MDQRAISIFTNFLFEKLDANIDNFHTFDFAILKGDEKYGDVYGPGMVSIYDIIKSIATLVYGDTWPELIFESINHGIYRIYTIIQYQRLLGVKMAQRCYKALNKYNPSEKSVRHGI